VHAWLFYEALDFSDVVDSPTRAVGEAIPDFFAVTHHGKTRMGEYLDQVIPIGSGRDLQDDDHFPETTQDAMSLTSSGLPEEDRSGEIFGSMLVDRRLDTSSQHGLEAYGDGPAKQS
jgi:hypothetical protein